MNKKRNLLLRGVLSSARALGTDNVCFLSLETTAIHVAAEQGDEDQQGLDAEGNGVGSTYMYDNCCAKLWALVGIEFAADVD